MTILGIRASLISIVLALMIVCFPLSSASAQTITSISPANGGVLGGQQVTILGAGFDNVTDVKFGGASATQIIVTSSTSLIAIAPPGSVGPVDVQVVTSAGTATEAGGYTYRLIPVITAISPSSGPMTGGTAVTITGENFVDITSVTFRNPVASFAVVSSTEIRVVTASSPTPGVQTLQVTSTQGTGLFTQYEFIGPRLSFAMPLTGPTTGGTNVELFGRGFTGATSVNFGNVPATSFTVIDDSRIRAISPPGSVGRASLQIVTPSGTSANDRRSEFRYFESPAPFITSVSPAIAPISGGTNVRITGTKFTGATSVTFGGVAATSVNVASATEITATVPAGTAGTAVVAITTPDGSGSANNAFSYVIAPSLAPINGVAIGHGSTGTPIDVTTAITGVASSIAVATAPAHGTISIAGNIVTYTPNAGYFGTDSFTITATNVAGTSAPASVSLQVAAPPRPLPPFVFVPSVVPVAFNSTGTTIDLTRSIYGLSTRAAIATAPANGTATIAGNIVTYVPTAGYFGPDSFRVTATGIGGTSAPETVRLTVATPPAPTAGAPSAVAVAHNSAGSAIDLTTSLSGVASSIAIATAPAKGTATVAGNIVTYVPIAGYFGADSFAYTATGPGGTSAPATVALTVATPPAPVAAARSGVAVAYNGTGVIIDLTDAVSGVSTGIAITTAPAKGSATLAGNVITYIPTAGSYGADSFTYTATGPGGASAPATVSLIIANPPAPTVTGRSGVAVAFNSQGTVIDLTSSVSGVASTISIVTPPARGTATVAGKVVTYTPTADSYGADSFTFTATGPGGTSAPATVSLTTAGAPPRVQPQSGSTGDGQMVSIELTRGAAIGPFTAATVVSVSPADAAKTVITSTGEGASRRFFLEATAAPRFGGTVSINYTLTNAFGVSPVGVVTLTVAARADPSKDPRVVALSDAQVQATRRFGRSQIANFMRRNEQLHSGRARSSQNVSVNIIDPTRERRPDDIMAPAAMPKRDSDRAAEEDAKEAATAAADAASVAPAAQDEKPAGVFGAMSMWVSGAIDIATRDASSFAPKLSATTQGISGGIDFQISKRTAIGFGGGYGYVTTDISDKAAELRASSNLVAVYGSTKLFENGFVDMVAGRGFLDYKTRRRIDGTELTALGTRSGTMNLAAVSFGINKQVKALDWSFYSKLEYMDAKLAAYTETSGGTRNNLRLSALDDTSYSAGLGFRLQKAYATGIGQVTPRLRGEFGREFGKADVQYVDYADIAGTTTRGIQGRHNEQNFYQTSIGTIIDLKDDWSFDLEYALMYNTATLSSGIKVQVSRAF